MEKKITINSNEFLDLYVVGDIHGEFRELVYNLTERYRIHDAVVIIAGDVGFGFESPGHYEHLYGRLKEKLEKHNLLIYCIRGNHDDPEYYGGQYSVDLPRLKTLPDWTVLEFWGKDILVLGGAVSVDKELRTPGDTWWEGEETTQLSIQELRENYGRVYCIISHDAPISFQPVISRTPMMSLEIYQGILKNREWLDTVLWELLPRRWYHGHYHQSISESNGVTDSRCLDIQEVIRIPVEEEYEIKKQYGTEITENGSENPGAGREA